MSTPLEQKSTVAEIRERFDRDVERFSNLETGQSATMDAPLAMELITQAAIASTQPIQKVLDIGCGAGNNTLKLRLALGSDFDAILIDLSEPMLARASRRISEINAGKITGLAQDLRDLHLEPGSVDVILAAAVLHHLREEEDWLKVFTKLHGFLRPGGSFWITDLVSHENSRVQALMWDRYGDYLTSLGGADYRDKVFAYIDKEDSPRPLTFQLNLLRRVGFTQVEVLHKNGCFAAFGAIRAD